MIESTYHKEKCCALEETKQEKVLVHKKKNLEEVVDTLHAAIAYFKNYLKYVVVTVFLHDKKPAYLISSIKESIE